jgi:hypothetical protein
LKKEGREHLPGPLSFAPAARASPDPIWPDLGDP